MKTQDKIKKWFDYICPDRDRLITNEDDVTAKILDAEDDVLNCTFHYDMAVKIDTKDLSHIYLDMRNLQTLQDLICDAEEYFEKYYENIDWDDYNDKIQ
jgi:hypothetical protein